MRQRTRNRKPSVAAAESVATPQVTRLRLAIDPVAKERMLATPASDLSGYQRLQPMADPRVTAAGGEMLASSVTSAGTSTSTSSAGGDMLASHVTGTRSSTWLARQPDGTWKAPAIQQWSATGLSGGNRQADVDARTQGMQVAAPGVYQPDLGRIPRETRGQLGLGDLGKDNAPTDGRLEGLEVANSSNITGAGTFTSTSSGTNTDPWQLGAITKIDPLTGKPVTSFVSGTTQTGGEYKSGVRAVGMSDDRRHTAQAEAGVVANGGASATLNLDTQNGLLGQAGGGGKVGAYGQADANTRTNVVNVGGVDYDAGCGAHGDAFAGAKAGAGATIGLGPTFAGAKGSAGAFAGAEAAGDVHGNIGPVGGKLGGSLLAGAGAGLDGDISFVDGKLHIGGKLYAALGFGASIGGDITIDVAKIGRTATDLACDVGQGIVDGATAVGEGILDGAAAVGQGLVDGACAVGDAVGDGIVDASTAVYNGIVNLFSW